MKLKAALLLMLLFTACVQIEYNAGSNVNDTRNPSEDTIPVEAPIKNVTENETEIMEINETEPIADEPELLTECIPKWSCTEWSECSKLRTKTRTCTDENECGEEEPDLVLECEYESEDALKEGTLNFTTTAKETYVGISILNAPQSYKGAYHIGNLNAISFDNLSSIAKTLPQGKYELKYDYYPFDKTETVYVEAGKTKNILVLVPGWASIRTTTGAGAPYDLHIDGEPSGTIDGVRQIQLESGNHTYKAKSKTHDIEISGSFETDLGRHTSVNLLFPCTENTTVCSNGKLYKCRFTNWDHLFTECTNGCKNTEECK